MNRKNDDARADHILEREQVDPESLDTHRETPLPSFTTITAKVSAVGSGGEELGAGTRITRFGLGNKAPSWMTAQATRKPKT